MTLLLFDVGGTLLKINPEPKEIYVGIFREMGFDVEKETLFRKIALVKSKIDNAYKRVDDKGKGVSFPMRFNELLLRECNLPCEKDVSWKVTRMFANGIRFTRYPETLPVLDDLGGGYEMGIISNWNLDRDLVDVLRENDILHYFDYTLASKDAGCEKPDPKIFNMALRNTGFSARDAYYIGDSYAEDVLGAIGTGIKPIFVNRRNEPNPKNVPSTDSLAGLTDLLENEAND
ncbi:MAG TPA: HAD family hydrolase [Candidatus Methanofastidiosa archaeon]|nr:HAD family hydrolase [Candidatus Methanofastidiosa archaeon]HPR41699.1 HAD family hydrolase [Candidatus Methanofastidiosa archaeon]